MSALPSLHPSIHPPDIWMAICIPYTHLRNIHQRIHQPTNQPTDSHDDYICTPSIHPFIHPPTPPSPVLGHQPSTATPELVSRDAWQKREREWKCMYGSIDGRVGRWVGQSIETDRKTFVEGRGVDTYDAILLTYVLVYVSTYYGCVRYGMVCSVRRRPGRQAGRQTCKQTDRQAGT